MIVRLFLALSLLAEGACFFAITNPAHPSSKTDLFWYESGAVGFFLFSLVLLRKSRIGRGATLAVIFGAAVVFNLLGLLSAPTTSDDDFRYAWDAKVQLSGTDPYRYTPADSALTELREPFLFPEERPCPRHEAPGGVCTEMNRPTVHTIYPPVAQLSFVAMRLGSFGGHGGHLPLQIGEILASLGVSALLAGAFLRRRAGPDNGEERAGERLGFSAVLWPVAIWAWCPVTVLELANNAHIDGVAVLFSVAAIFASRNGRDRLAGVWLGAAIATKLYPALLLPAMIKRRPLVVSATAVTFVAVTYIPHVLAVGKDVIGYLPGYLQEEKYISGGRFILINQVLPAAMCPYVAGLLLLALTALVWRYYCDPQRPEIGALYLVGGFFLIVTPSLSWYPLLLLALAALARRPEWLGVVLAPSFMYIGGRHGWDTHILGPVGFALGGLIVLLALMMRPMLADRSA